MRGTLYHMIQERTVVIFDLGLNQELVLFIKTYGQAVLKISVLIDHPRPNPECDSL